MAGTGASKRDTEGHCFAPGGELESRDERLRTGERVCEVRRIALLPEFRGRKLAYALMLDLIQRAREMGYTRMILWTNSTRLHRAVDFYHQLGFTDLPVDGLNAGERWRGLDI
jgi:GNAT superfamily N-acetyltransferase